MGFIPTWNVEAQLTLLQPAGQIMPTPLLLAHPDLKTQRQLCYVMFEIKKKKLNFLLNA